MMQQVAVKPEFEAGLQCDDWETLSVNPTVNGYTFFRIREG